MSMRSDWNPDPSRVVVVPAGHGAHDQAAMFSLYHCQNRRSFKASGWMAFYSFGKIGLVGEIDGPPEDDVVIASRPELAQLAAHMAKSNGKPEEPHTLFRLKNVVAVGPIRNDKRTVQGKVTAWTQLQRYTTIDRLRAARLTSELID